MAKTENSNAPLLHGFSTEKALPVSIVLPEKFPGGFPEKGNGDSELEETSTLFLSMY